jgi:uncharacterized membrane protein
MNLDFDGGIYNLLLFLHLVAVVVGFGTVMLNGLYAARAKRAGGREGVAIAEANTFVSEKVAEPFIYAVFVLGILLVLVGDEVWEWDQAWINISMLLYIVGIGLSHGLLRPSVRRMNALTAQLAAGGPSLAAAGAPPEVAEVEALEKRIAAVGMALNLLVVVIIALMVWKPGAPF